MSKRKIETLLRKLSSMLLPEPSLSILEQDLVKGYLRELYEIVTEMEEGSTESRYVPEVSEVKTHKDLDVTADRTAIKTSFPLTHDQEPPPKDPLREDPHAPEMVESSPNNGQSLIEEVEVTKDISTVEIKAPSVPPEEDETNPSSPPSTRIVEQAATQPRITEEGTGEMHAQDSEGKSISNQSRTQEPSSVIKENLREIIEQQSPVPPKYSPLFEQGKGNELSDRLSRTPIQDLQRAFGINDKLLVTNELFDGNSDFFNETLDVLNRKYSFEEAKSHIIRHIVDKYQWLDDQRLEGARQFIKLVERRYQRI
ncbi:MAG: hypothetical protein HKN87_05080 [Saprospiraceae bacterium]|nr:hypothetical protein [Saprospiraceae bacterium]